MDIKVEQPATPADWHAVMQQHIGHKLAVDAAYQASTQIVKVESVCYDGRMSAYVNGQWCADLRMLPFFGTRRVTCWTCDPAAHTHLFVVQYTYSSSEGCRSKHCKCECGDVSEFSVPAP